MSWYAEFPYEWKLQESFRCIALEHLDPDLKKSGFLSRFFLPAGIDAGRALEFLRSNGYVALSSAEMIAGNIEYVFAERESYHENRFNDETFPALYSAYELHSAVTERQKYVEDRDKPFDYGVFSLLLSGRASDLREAIRLKRWTFPDDHAPCREVGKKIKEAGFDGLIAPSKEAVGGTSLAIFERHTVDVGEMIKFGRL